MNDDSLLICKKTVAEKKSLQAFAEAMTHPDDVGFKKKQRLFLAARNEVLAIKPKNTKRRRKSGRIKK